MSGKRLNKNNNEILEEIRSHLNENNQMNDDILELLKKLDIKDGNIKVGNVDTKEEENIIEDSLFDIKSLNSIEDKMIRGTAKKIYMSGKRSGKNSSDVIDKIINTLNDIGKLNEEIESFLKGLK